ECDRSVALGGGHAHGSGHETPDPRPGLLDGERAGAYDVVGRRVETANRRRHVGHGTSEKMPENRGVRARADVELRHSSRKRPVDGDHDPAPAGSSDPSNVDSWCAEPNSSSTTASSPATPPSNSMPRKSETMTKEIWREGTRPASPVAPRTRSSVRSVN